LKIETVLVIVVLGMFRMINKPFIWVATIAWVSCESFHNCPTTSKMEITE